MLVTCKRSCHRCAGDQGAYRERAYQYLEKHLEPLEERVWIHSKGCNGS